MKIVLIGATGLIGRHLVRYLSSRQHEIVVVSHNPLGAQKIFPSISIQSDIATALIGTDVVVNLAGDNIGQGLWTPAKKKRILKSRLAVSRQLVTAIQNAAQRPQVLIQASAIGFYGNRGDEQLNEKSAPGLGFLSEVCQQWEKALLPIEKSGVRTVYLRTAPVLARGEGILEILSRPFRFFAGGIVGNPIAWFSCIHVDDLVRAIEFLIKNSTLSGPFNLATPHPVQTREFYQSLGKVLHRPCWLPLPPFAVQLLLGEKGRELILTSQRVVPEKLLRTGFQFRFPTIKEILKDLL